METSEAQRVAGQHAELLAVERGEAGGVAESPSSGDGADGVAVGGVGCAQVAVGSFESNPAKEATRCEAVAAQYSGLQGPRGDPGRLGDVGDADRFLRMRVDVGD